MSLQSGTGVSNDEDAYAAGVRACTLAVSPLDAEPTLVLVFASVAYDQKRVLEGVRFVVPQAQIVGASTAGEIATGGPVPYHSVVVMALSSDSLTVKTAHATGLKDNSHNIGATVAKEIKTALGMDPKLFMMFADGLSGNGSDAVRGIQDEFGATLPIIGGSAGDDGKYAKTFQYHGTEAYSDTLVGVGLGGTFSFGVGSKHGWMPITQPMQVTKAEGAVLYEINGKPPIELYKEYISAEAAETLANNILSGVALSYPLGFKHKGSEEYILRAPFIVNKDGSIVCGGEVPVGAEVQLMIGGKDEAVLAAREAALSAMKDLGGKPRAVLIFDCHTRHKLFGTDSKLEIDAIQEVVGKEVPLAGFYTYAEQGPVHEDVVSVQSNSLVLNETVVVVLLGD